MQTVGRLVGVVGAGRVTDEVAAIGAGCAVALGGIEVVQVARGRIRPTYLLDAIVEAGFVARIVKGRRQRPRPG